MKSSDLKIIGRNAIITLGGIKGVPAKVDTGADTSSVWATDIREENDHLYFRLFSPKSDYYTGAEIVADPGTYDQRDVSSSSGEKQRRYAVTLPVIVEGVSMEARFTLANRHAMAYPVLLGLKLLDGKFVVDVRHHIPEHFHEMLHQKKHARQQDR